MKRTIIMAAAIVALASPVLAHEACTARTQVRTTDTRGLFIRKDDMPVGPIISFKVNSDGGIDACEAGGLCFPSADLKFSQACRLAMKINGI